MMDTCEDIGEDVIDALKELGNISSAKAAMALSKQLGTEIVIDVTNVHYIDVENVPEIVGGLDMPSVGIYMSLDNFGLAFILLSISGAKKLIKLFTQRMGLEDVVLDSDEGRDILYEVGNICISSYISAIGGIMNEIFIPQPPFISIDMVGALLTVPLVEIASEGTKAIVIETRFIPGVDMLSTDNSQWISGYMLFVPKKDVRERMVSCIRGGGST